MESLKVLKKNHGSWKGHREACMYQHNFIESSLIGTVLQANVTETEQNSNVDKIKHLFIYKCVL